MRLLLILAVAILATAIVPPAAPAEGCLQAADKRLLFAGAAPEACQTIVNAAAVVTNVSRLPAGRYEVAVRLVGRRTVAVAVTARRYYPLQIVRVSGKLCAENRIEGATLRQAANRGGSPHGWD